MNLDHLSPSLFLGICDCRGEATKGEQDEDEAVEDREADVAEDHSTLKSDETDDHEDILEVNIAHELA